MVNVFVQTRYFNQDNIYRCTNTHVHCQQNRLKANKELYLREFVFPWILNWKVMYRENVHVPISLKKHAGMSLRN